MEVILKQDVPNLGRIGELVKVKPGYARNYLIPRDLAVGASKGQKSFFEHQKRIVESIKKRVQKESQDKASEYKSIVLKLEKRFNESGKMFGSVTAHEVVVLLEKEGHRFDRRDVSFEMIREVGTYEVSIRLPGDVNTTCQLKVTASADSESKTGKKAAKGKTSGARKAKKTETAAAEEATENETQDS